MSKEIDQHVLHFFQPKKLLGSGAYGHVWKAIDRRTHKPYALKKIFDAFQNSTDAQRTYRQITILTQLEHPNIIQLSRVIRARNNRDLYLVFEFMEADLHSLVGQQVLQSVHLRYVTYQILRAVGYLHSAQLLHRDLKPSNVLINSECEVKLCDFGLARTLTCEEERDLILSEEVATRWYRSPQMLLGSRSYSKPTDVWSVGCIVAELLLGQPIFPGTSTLNQLQKIVEFTGVPSKESVDQLRSEVAENLLNQLSTRRRPLKEYFQCKQPQLIDLVVKMLQFNPCKRITVQEAMRSPCLQEFAQRQEGGVCCSKFVVPCVDDNVKLTLQQYRKIIYQDIERRYPQQNCGYANSRSTGSFSKPKKVSVEEPKRKIEQSPPENSLKRQKSLIAVNDKCSSPLLKRLESANPYKAVLEQAKQMKQQQSQGQLKKAKSRKQLLKKKVEGKPVKFKKG